MKTELNIVEGMQFDRGYTSAYMVTDTDTVSYTHLSCRWAVPAAPGA